MNLVVSLCLCWVVLCSSFEDKLLHFNKDGRFKVVQFTDLHYGNDEHENEKTYSVQDAILTSEQPDLVIITGDLVSGYEWDGRAQGWFQNRWRKLVSPMIKHNIRWAIALGNHDVEGDLNGVEIAKLDSSEDLSLTQLGPIDVGGATNYYLPIYNYNSTGDEIGQILWIFDSGNRDCQNVFGWGCVQYSQVAWYRNTSRTLAAHYNGNHAIPALAFFHIPLYEHLDLWNVKGVYGDLAEGEGVCCSSLNTGLYSAMKEMGDVKGVYCGHDHNNDYIGDYHGIHLGFGRKTGYGSYGPPWGWKRGARVLEISQNEFGAKTWLRLEDGNVEIQKYNTVSMRKFLGCCYMEGHDRVVLGWFGILTVTSAILILISLISISVMLAVRAYRKRNDHRYDAVCEQEGYEAPNIGSRGTYPSRFTIPRQRKGNFGQELA